MSKLAKEILWSCFALLVATTNMTSDEATVLLIGYLVMFITLVEM